MMKKIVVTVVVIVAILGIAFAAYSNSNSKNPTTNVTNTSNNSTGTSNVSVSNTTPNNTQTSATTASNNTQSIISPAEAQEIATKYIEVSGVTAGTPTLKNESGTQVYIVPLINTNNTNVGEIDIDAITGKNLGGAGGAP